MSACKRKEMAAFRRLIFKWAARQPWGRSDETRCVPSPALFRECARNLSRTPRQVKLAVLSMYDLSGMGSVGPMLLAHLPESTRKKVAEWEAKQEGGR